MNLSITQRHLLSAEHGYGLMLFTFTVIAIAFVMLSVLVILRVKRQRDQRELEQHSITADELRALLASNQEVLLFDVRQPLHLLANSKIIPKAQTIPPDKVLQKRQNQPRRFASRIGASFLTGQIPQGRISSLEGERVSGRTV